MAGPLTTRRGAAMFLAALILGLALNFVASGTGTTTEPDHPPVIVIGLEATRADALPCYGYSRDTAPNICDLAADGVLFEHAYSQGSWTPIALPSLLTGLPPNSVSLPTWNYTLNDNATLFTETLAQQAGYRTLALTSKTGLWALAEGNGFDRRYNDGELRPRSQEEIVSRFDRTPAPDAYWLFLTRFAHYPYAPDDPYRIWENVSLTRDELENDYPKSGQERGPHRLLRVVDNETLRALYDEEILQGDARIGAFLDRLEDAGIYDDALIVVTSDHGQMFGTPNDLYGHAHKPYDQLTHIPLIIKFPGNRWAGKRVEQPVRHIDVNPTITDVVGVDNAAPVMGTSLLPAIQGEDLGLTPFSAEFPFRNWVLARDGYRLLIHDTRAGCSGTATSGMKLVRENTTLAGPPVLDGRRSGRMQDELCGIYQAGLRHLFPPSRPELTPDIREMLTELGYL